MENIFSFSAKFPPSLIRGLIVYVSAFKASALNGEDEATLKKKQKTYFKSSSVV